MTFSTYYQDTRLKPLSREQALLEATQGNNVYVCCGFGDDLDSRVEVVVDDPRSDPYAACLWPACSYHSFSSTPEEAFHDAECHASECTGRRE